MNLLATHGACVCVHGQREKRGDSKTQTTKSQDSGPCESTHTHYTTLDSRSSSSIASQSASRVVGGNGESASTLLAQCEVIDIA